MKLIFCVALTTPPPPLQDNIGLPFYSPTSMNSYTMQGCVLTTVVNNVVLVLPIELKHIIIEYTL